MEDKPKGESGRFALRLPPDLNAEVRALAKGNGSRPPAGINDTILFLIKEGLKSVKSESKPGERVPARLEAASA